MSQRVSVIILTKNEEARVARAIRSAWWADEVLVVDSESSDKTRQIAKEEGANVIVQPWLGWVPQHNRAQVLAAHDWVFFLDCDEIVTPALADSICSAMSGTPDPRSVFYVDRRDEYLGRLMPSVRRRKRGADLVRLYNRKHSSWDSSMLIHERVIYSGSAILLRGHLLHWRNHTIGQQVDTFNRNADLEARAMASSEWAGTPLAIAIKPALRFAWVYLWCGYWRKGTRGLIDAGTHAFSEFLRHAKLWEIRNAPPCLDPPLDIYTPPENPALALRRSHEVINSAVPKSVR
jgi:(heptosyl)LPS beta-1,4-glucosyltransferase